MYAGGGKTPVDESTASYRKKIELILRGCYHQACDHYREGWDLSGAIEDLQLFYQVGYDIAESADWPKWYPTAEFSR